MDSPLPRIRLGADSLCWHLRLLHRACTLSDVLAEAAEAGARCLDVMVDHLPGGTDLAGAEAARAEAEGHRLELIAGGGSIAAAEWPEGPSACIAAVRAELMAAKALGSPLLKVYAGFSRIALAADPDALQAEREHVRTVLRAVAAHAEEAGVAVQVENLADFTAGELRSIVEDVGSPTVGVFLDLANPIASFQDPAATLAELAPLAGPAVHVKDYRVVPRPVPDSPFRAGFDVRWCHPGEGVADIGGVCREILPRLPHREITLIVEGLDQTDSAGQVGRLQASFAALHRALGPALAEA